MPDLSHAPALEDAIALAADAHRGQIYPTASGEPFILHPLRVMLRVESTAERIVAVLHDLIEDTAYTLDDLRLRGYQDDVIEAVDCLTRRNGETYEHYIERVASNAIARRVKLADLAENLENNRRQPRTAQRAERIRRYERAQERLAASVFPRDSAHKEQPHGEDDAR